MLVAFLVVAVLGEHIRNGKWIQFPILNETQFELGFPHPQARQI